MQQPGRFYGYDLMTTDPKAAQSFYERLTGWGTMIVEGAGMPYTMWTNGEALLGEAGELPEDARKAGAPSH